MRARDFDELARSFATARGWPLDRRQLLAAFGLGAASVTMAAHNPPPVASQPATPAPGIASLGLPEPAGPNVADKAWELEFDLQAIFAFVRDSVLYDPYPGVLRGARGTLWSLAGNSADQALLLAELLTASQLPVRFALGAIDDTLAAKLVASAAPDPATLSAHRLATLSLQDSDSESSDTMATPTAGVDEFVAQLPARRRAMLDLAEQRLQHSLATIEQQLAGAGIELPRPTLAVPERERTNHVWIQVQDGADWVDLDPSVPGAEFGKRYADAARTASELPADLFHQVRFRLSVETISAGSLQRSDLMTLEARSAELTGHQLGFVHLTPDSLAAAGSAIAGALAGYVTYIPHFFAGEQVTRGEPLRFATGDGAIASLGGAGFDGDTIAEWLEIDILSPDAPTVTVSRELFDRAGEEARATGTIDLSTLGLVDLVALPDGTHGYLPLLGINTLTVTTSVLPISAQLARADPADPVDGLSVVNGAYTALRDSLAAQLPGAAPFRLFLDRPNVALVSQTPIALEGSDATLENVVDLLHRGFRPVPLASGAAHHPLVVAGIVSHIAERTLLGDGGTAPVAGNQMPIVSVGRLFETALMRDIPIHTLLPGASADDLAVSARAKRRIGAATAAGLAVIVPERSIELDGVPLAGWWEVDLSSGLALDRMETGRGEGEYAMLLRIARVAYKFLTTGHCVGAAGLAAVAALMMGAVDGEKATQSPSRFNVLSGYAGAATAGTGAIPLAAGCAAAL